MRYIPEAPTYIPPPRTPSDWISSTVEALHSPGILWWNDAVLLSGLPRSTVFLEVGYKQAHQVMVLALFIHQVKHLHCIPLLLAGNKGRRPHLPLRITRLSSEFQDFEFFYDRKLWIMRWSNKLDFSDGVRCVQPVDSAQSMLRSLGLISLPLFMSVFANLLLPLKWSVM